MKANLLIAVGLVYSVGTFAESQDLTNHAVVIPKGFSAVGISAGALNDLPASVKAGDRVDILATYRDPVAKQEVTKILMQNVLVLAVRESKPDTGRTNTNDRSITLAVTPEQTELVTAADRAGALRISLRPLPDQAIEVHVRPAPSRPPVGDFWLPGEFQRLLEQRKQQRREKTE